MSKKVLFVYNSIKLFEILSEIRENLNFEINHIDQESHQKTNFKEYDNSIIVTTKFSEKLKNCLVIDNLPLNIYDLIEKINLSFLRNKFNNQSKIEIGRYILDLNSRKISFDRNSLNLTEKECDLLLFLKTNKKVSLKEIQKNVWNYGIDLETHTVETHIYRIRKKILKNFNDDYFIGYDKKGYFLN